MPSAVQLIRSSVPPLTPYAAAATAPREARLIVLAGACPLDEHGATVGVGDLAAQAARCVETLTQALADAGATLTDVLATRVLVASTDRADLGTVWGVVHDAFDGHEVPSTLLGVTVLGWPDQLVEIEAIAAVVDPDH